MHKFIRSLARDINQSALKEIASAAETYAAKFEKNLSPDDHDENEDAIATFVDLANACHAMLRLAEPEMDYIVQTFTNEVVTAGDRPYKDSHIFAHPTDALGAMYKTLMAEDDVVRIDCWKREDGKAVDRMWELTKG